MTNNSNKEFKDKLKEFRKNNKMTQKDLAEKLGVSRSNIAEMEAGRVKGRLETIEKLSEISGHPLTYWANCEEIDIRLFESIRVLGTALIKAGKIKEDGKIPEEFKESVLEQLEQEFALLYNQINK